MAKEKTTTFWEDLKRDTKNVASGVASAIPHLVTNFPDSIAKTSLIFLSMTPIAGAITAGIYVAKESYQQTGNGFNAVAKGLIVGAISMFVPPFAPAVTAIYAIKNIGAQIEEEAIKSGKSRGEVIKDKWYKAADVVKSLRTEQGRKEFGEILMKATENLKSWDNIKQITTSAIVPVKPQQKSELNEPLTSKAQNHQPQKLISRGSGMLQAPSTRSTSTSITSNLLYKSAKGKGERQI